MNSREPAGAAAPHQANRLVTVVCLSGPPLAGGAIAALSPALPQMAEHFGGNPLLAQLIMTFPGIMMIVGAASASFLAENIGRRNVVLIGLLVYAVSGAFGLIAPTFETLAASRFVLGYAAGATLSTCLALVGEYYEGTARERMLGFTSAAASIATVAVLQIGGVIVEHFGWRGPFMLYLLALIVLPFAWLGLAKGLTHRSHEKISWVPLLPLSPYYLLLAVYTIGMFTPLLQIPILAASKGVESPETLATLVSIASVMGAVTALFYGLMRRFMGFTAMFLWCSLAIGIGALLAAQAVDVTALAVAACVFGLGIGVIEPTILSQLLLKTEDKLHDRAMGVSIACLFLGQFINPWVMAPLRENFGIASAFNILGLAHLVGGAVLVGAMLTRKRAPQVA